MKPLVLVVVACAFIFGVGGEECVEPDRVVACYYGSWAVYREGIGTFTVDNITSSLCTHLIYTFAGLNIDSKITTLDSWNDVDSNGYLKFTAMKNDNPCLKTLLAIGGWNEGSRKYSVMASTAASREAFVESVLRFVVAYDFDGFDFDWEYPTERGGIAADKDNFSELLKLLKSRLSTWNLLLTIAVPISTDLSDKAYNITTISEYVDYVFLMAYDYTPTTSEVTGLLAPLSSIGATVNYWLSKGLPNSKLILGIPTYARSFALANSSKHDIGDPVAGLGEAGSFTQEQGFLSYYELESKLATQRFTIVATNESTYYAYSSDEWLSFDLQDSYRLKAQYVLDNNLRGAMIWSIDTDDFGGYFNTEEYPVLKTINNVLRNGTVKL